MRTINAFVSIISLIFSTQVLAAGQDVVSGKYTPGFYSTTNFIKNPSCISNANDISVTGTGTVSRTTTTPIDPPASCLVSGGATTGATVKFAGSLFNLSQKGQNCEARFRYYGDASKYKAYVNLGSTKVSADYALVDSGTDAKTVSMNFPCGDGSQVPYVVVESTNTTTPAFRVGAVYVGDATNIASAAPQAQLLGTVKISNCAAAWTTTSSTYADFSAQTGCTYTTTGQALAPSTNIPAIKFASLPAGDYRLEYEGQIGLAAASGAPQIGFQFWDGTNTAREESTAYQFQNQQFMFSGISQSISYSSSQSNITLSIRAKTSVASNPAAVAGVTSNPGVIKVWYFPPASGNVIKPEAQALNPAGEVLAFSGAICPAGWLKADGAAVSRSAYAQLFNRLGTAHGSGDGSTTFNVPDYRGVFLRGANSFSSVAASGTAASNNVTATAHGINRTGFPVRVTGTPVTGLNTTTTYYAIVVDANTLAFATSHANALAGTKITISGSAASMTVAQWIDPDTRLAVAPGGSTSGVGSFQYGQIESHSHNYDSGGNGYYILKQTGGAVGLTSGTALANTATSTIATGGNETRPLNALVQYCVRAYDISAPAPLLVNAVYAPGVDKAEVFSASYGTTNATTVCSASPCSYLDQIGNSISSITRSGVGTYTINFGKTYSKLKCTVNAYNGAGTPATALPPVRCESCSSVAMTTAFTSTTATNDTAGTLTCQGTPQ